MEFVRARCGQCGFVFRVVVQAGERFVQADRAAWARTCPLIDTCAEPRMCGNLRRAAHAIEPASAPRGDRR